MIMHNAEVNFFQVFAQENGFEILGATTLDNTIYGVTNVLTGIVCDLINPAILLVVALVGQIAVPFIWANCETQAMITLSIIIYYSTKYYGNVFRIIAMKSVAKSEQRGTLCDDVLG